MKWIFILSLLLSLPAFSADKSTKQLSEPNCDYPGKNLSAKKTKSATECQQRCSNEPKCTRWVFVSGWNQCSLKEGDIKKRSVQLWSAQGDDKPKQDIDHSSKDFAHKPHVKSAEACQKLCSALSDCSAMTFIAGYNDCYLKNGKGEYREKIFYCGIQKTKH